MYVYIYIAIIIHLRRLISQVIHVIIDSYRFSTFIRAKNWKCRIQNPEKSTRCFELLLFPSKFYWKSMEIPSFPHDFPTIFPGFSHDVIVSERFPVALCGTWNVSMVPIGMSRCGRTTMPRSMGRALNPSRCVTGRWAQKGPLGPTESAATFKIWIYRDL